MFDGWYFENWNNIQILFHFAIRTIHFTQ
jgi:hypothetical protein